MTVVTGDIRLVTDRPDSVSQVWLRAPKGRVQGTAYVTESPDAVQVNSGSVSFTALPGPLVMVLVSQGQPLHSVKIIVPDKSNATLRECIEAVGLVDDGTLNALEELALEVSAIAGQIASVEQLETWAGETATAAAQAQTSKNEANDAANRAGTHASNAKQSETNSKQSESNAVAAAESVSSTANEVYGELQGFADSASGSASSAAASAAEAKTSETNARAHEVSASSSAQRAEFAAEETIQQVEGDFATRNYVDAQTWHNDTPDTAWNIEDFPRGIWKVENAEQRTRLGLPNKLGVLVMHVVSPARQSVQDAKTAYWLSLSHSSPTEMLIRSTSNTGVWETEWQPTFRYEPPTKQASVPLTFPRGSSYSDDRPTLTMRIPFKFGAAVKRARLRLRNYDYRSDHGFPGAYRIVGAAIGKHQINDDGSMTGLIPEGESVTQLMSSTSMTGPDEAAGDWVNVDLEPNTDYLLSYSITADDGMIYARQTTHCWTNRLSSGWNRTGVMTATPSGMGPLSAILDVEVLKDVPIYGYLGDSQTAAISAARPGYDSWAMVHSRLGGAIPTIHGHAGGGLQEWQTASKPAYGISDGMAKFDRMYISMGSNDIDNGRPFTGVQDYLRTVMQNWRKQTSTFVLHNYLPRTGVESSDTVRQALNNWLRASLPNGALHTVDIWGATVDPATGLMDERWRASTVDVHMTSAGNARLALATLGGGSAGAELQKANAALRAEIAERHRDTGLRDLNNVVPANVGWTSPAAGAGVFAQRVGNTVFLTISGVINSSGSTQYVTLANLPVGLRPNKNQFGNTWRGVRTYLRTSGQLDFQGPSGSSDYWSFSWVTNDSWPASLPGTPA